MIGAHVVPLLLEYMVPPAPAATYMVTAVPVVVTVPTVTARRSFELSGLPALQIDPAIRGTAETEGVPAPPGPPSVLPFNVNE